MGWGVLRKGMGRLLAVAVVTLAAAPGAFAQNSQTPLGPECNRNYDWVCVPNARDVDCAGGNGNGPAYVEGPVHVIGSDPYELDRDGDGYACEPYGWSPPS